jgi:hypothetical protein
MTSTQVKAMRELWATVTRDSSEVVTAKEMALTPHRLSKDGNHCKTANGDKYVWDNYRNAWLRTN